MVEESRASPARALPRFDLDEYDALLVGLLGAGWAFGQVREMATDRRSHVAFLRHDVDFHLHGIDAIAEVEANRGVASTWYVLLSGPYNPMNATNRTVLRGLIDMGHDVGLHYDVSLYPTDPSGAVERLHWECDALAQIVGRSIRTICMHQPGLAGADPFLEIDPYVHPHHPHFQNELLYVSDSCRAWRDETLLTSLEPGGPDRMLLNTHPELWLDGSISDRLDYLDQVVRTNITHLQHSYIDHEVRELWRTHPGAVAHDRREQAKRSEDSRPR